MPLQYKEILPDAMQAVDRFYLHQNLLEVVKNTIKAIVPVNVKIPVDRGREQQQAEPEGCDKVKKSQTVWITVLNIMKKVYNYIMPS